MNNFSRLLNAFTVCCLCLAGLSSKAQDRTEYLTLDDGEVIECYVLKIEDDQVHILRNGTKEEVLPLARITNFSEVAPASATVSNDVLVNKRFYSTADLGFMIGRSLNNSNTGFSVHYYNTYHFKPKLGLGAGVGYEWMERSEYMPTYGVVRFFPFDKGNAPFLMLKSGYTFVASSRATSSSRFSTTRRYGGFMSEAFLGFQSLDNIGRTGFEIGIGYRLQYLYTKESYNYEISPDWWWSSPPYPSGTVVETFQQLHRITFRLGLTF